MAVATTGRRGEGRRERVTAREVTAQKEFEESRREAEVLRRKSERLLRTLQPIREKEDLEMYLKGLEHTLTQCQVAEEE